MEKLLKLIEKKKQEGKEMDPMDKDAKMSMLQALKQEMTGMMKDDLHPKAKVEVASDSEEGLSHGLDKAKEALAAHMGQSDSDDASEDDEDEVSDGEHESEVEPSDEASEEHDKPEAGHMIGEQIEHEDAEGELSDEDVAHLERLLAKAKMKKKI